MKIPMLFLSLAAALLLAGTGCGHLDTSGEGDPNRIVSGVVNVRMNLLPPPDCQVVVRLIEPPDVTAAPTAASKDMVIGERGTRERPEQVVAEQVIRAPAALPVPFQLEFHADDAQLRHGFNIEARISWGGRLRFRNIESQAVTLDTVAKKQTISLWLEPVQ